MDKTVPRDDLLHHAPWLSSFDSGFFRSPGPGLGNLLFPISRALIGQKRYGGRFVYPTMRQIKIGTFLRGERDKRTYGDVLRGRSRAEWADWFSAWRGGVVSEHAFDGFPRGVTVRYEGLGDYFHSLTGHRDLVAHWLARSLRRPVPDEPFDIGIHVRQGDFTSGDPNAPQNNIRQPTEWYRAALDEARRMLGKDNPSIVLFTDGNPSAVSDDLRAGALSFDRSQDALQSILTLSRARILVPSRSSFSMWAAFLGGMPAIWDRRHESRTKTLPERPGLDHVV